MELIIKSDSKSIDLIYVKKKVRIVVPMLYLNKKAKMVNLDFYLVYW